MHLVAMSSRAALITGIVTLIVIKIVAGFWLINLLTPGRLWLLRALFRTL